MRPARVFAAGLPWVVALTACNAIVGIEDLHVQGGKDASFDAFSSEGGGPAEASTDGGVQCNVTTGPTCVDCCRGAFARGVGQFSEAGAPCGCQADGGCFTSCNGTALLCRDGTATLQSCLPCLRSSCPPFQSACDPSSSECAKYLACLMSCSQ